MKPLTLVLPLALLGGCDRVPAPADKPSPVPAAIGKPEQTRASIMRPEVVPPQPEASRIEPLRVTISFGAGGTSLSTAEIGKLSALIDSPQVKASGAIRLAAHSDSAGSDSGNLAASRERGEVVRDWLVESGIAEERITLVAFGEQNPVRPNALPDGSPNIAGRNANRRVEILVAVADGGVATTQPRTPTLAEEIVESAEARAAQERPFDNSD